MFYVEDKDAMVDSYFVMLGEGSYGRFLLGHFKGRSVSILES